MCTVRIVQNYHMFRVTLTDIETPSSFLDVECNFWSQVYSSRKASLRDCSGDNCMLCATLASTLFTARKAILLAEENVLTVIANLHKNAFG